MTAKPAGGVAARRGRLPWVIGALVAVGLAAGLAWARWNRPGTSSLPERAAPPGGCAFEVKLDRASADGEPVQFGDLRCGASPEPALRVGPRWFRLPLEKSGAEYPLVRRTPNGLHWLVDSGQQVYRSDDGGRTFVPLGPPGWTRVSLAGEPSGEKLEWVTLATEAAPGLVERVKLAWRSRAAFSAAGGGLRALRAAWKEAGEARRSVSLTHDAGRTWEARPDGRSYGGWVRPAADEFGIP